MWWCIPDTSGERLNGIQEVNSSILSVSTIIIRKNPFPLGNGFFVVCSASHFAEESSSGLLISALIVRSSSVMLFWFLII